MGKDLFFSMSMEKMQRMLT